MEPVELEARHQTPRPAITVVRAWHREAMQRIRADFLEMPGMQLTLHQGARLWHLEIELCGRALRQLVEDGFLMCRRGQYMRP